jgi:DNA-binding ferritin-like protein
MGYLEKMKTGGTKTSVASLVAEMLDAANKIHILHLTVTGKGSYAAHKALGDLYEALPDLADGIAEGYQGVTGKLLEYPDVSAPRLKTVEDAIDYIEDLHNKVSKVQDGVEFSEIVNDLDNVKSELNSAKYKLKFLS